MKSTIKGENVFDEEEYKPICAVCGKNAGNGIKITNYMWEIAKYDYIEFCEKHANKIHDAIKKLAPLAYKPKEEKDEI